MKSPRSLGRKPRTIVPKAVVRLTRAERREALKAQAAAAKTVTDLSVVVQALVTELDG